jgi:cation-transporting ATPase G
VLVILNAIRAARTHTLPGVTTPPRRPAAPTVDIGAPPRIADPCCGPTNPAPAAAGTLNGVPSTSGTAPVDQGCACCPTHRRAATRRRQSDRAATQPAVKNHSRR